MGNNLLGTQITKNGKTAELIQDKQEKLLEPLNALGAEYKIVGDGIHHFVAMQNKRCKIAAYPAMWCESSILLPAGTITLADKLLKYALPKADELIRNGWKRCFSD